MALMQDLTDGKLHLVGECHHLESLNVHSDIVESTGRKKLDRFATFEPLAA